MRAKTVSIRWRRILAQFCCGARVSPLRASHCAAWRTVRWPASTSHLASDSSGDAPSLRSRTSRWAEQDEDVIAEFIRWLVFNTLIGNADMHLKNCSVIYPDRRNPMLALGYDFVSTIVYLSDENMALRYARSKRMAELSCDELAYLAAKARLPEEVVLDTAADTVARFHEVWGQQKSRLGLPASTVETIDSHLARIPLAAR